MTAPLNETIITNKQNFGFHYDKVNVLVESTDYLDVNDVTFTFYSNDKKVGVYVVQLEARYTKTSVSALEEITKIKYTNEGYFETF